MSRSIIGRTSTPETLSVGELETPPLAPGEDEPFEEHEILDFLHQYEASRAAVIAKLHLKTIHTYYNLQYIPQHRVLSSGEVLDH